MKKVTPQSVWVFWVEEGAGGGAGVGCHLLPGAELILPIWPSAGLRGPIGVGVGALLLSPELSVPKGPSACRFRVPWGMLWW